MQQGQNKDNAGRTTPPASRNAGRQDDEPRASNVDTGGGLVGSDVLDLLKNPHGSSTDGDPSDVVEVSPEDLVNRHSLDATALNPNRPGTRGRKVAEKNGVEVRRVDAQRGDTSTGQSGAPAGTDATGIAGVSGGTAGGAGPAGSGTGAKA